MRKVIIGCLIVLGLLGGGLLWSRGCSGGAHPITNEHPRGRVIIAFGDSLTAGVGAAAGESYPDQLSRRLGIPIINAGHGGDTTGDALQRLDRDVLQPNPGIVLVQFGGNDMLRKVPREETFRNLESIVRRIQAKGALAVLVGCKSAESNAYGSDDYAALARKTGCPLVADVLDGIWHDPALMSADAIHPNEKGYAKVAEKIEAVVKRYVEASR